MTARLADRAARFLGRRVSRRRFLERTAMASTALAVAPTDFVLRPSTAYAAHLQLQRHRVRVRVALLRRLHRVLLHPHGDEHVPAGHDRRWVVEGRRVLVLRRAPLLHRLQREPAGAAPVGSAPTAAPTPRGAAAAPRATATTARRAAPSSATASATSRSRRSAASRAGSCPATPAVLVVGNCAPTVAVDDSTANHNKPCLQQTPPPTTPTADDGMPDGRDP